VAGHEIADVEQLVERGDRCLVVEQTGDVEVEVVEHTDPRRPLD
jgi:hypothetical protein